MDCTITDFADGKYLAVIERKTRRRPWGFGLKSIDRRKLNRIRFLSPVNGDVKQNRRTDLNFISINRGLDMHVGGRCVLHKNETQQKKY